jgi:hypothetical protein
MRRDEKAAKELFALGMDQFEAGRIVLRGMRNNDLYILSHPEFEQGIRDRNEALLASIPRDLKAPESRIAMERETYIEARDRRR